MLPLLSFPYLTSCLHEGEFAAVEMGWLGYAPGVEFRATITQALQLGQQHRVKGWLSDDRLLGAVRPRDLQWVLEVALPELGSIGVQRFALLESHNALNRMTIASMYAQAQPRFTYEIRRFDDLAAARAWATGHA